MSDEDDLVQEQALVEGLAKGRVVWFEQHGTGSACCSWFDDLLFLCANEHTLASLWFGHACHPLRWCDRAAFALRSLCGSFLLCGLVFRVRGGYGVMVAAALASAIFDRAVWAVCGVVPAVGSAGRRCCPALSPRQAALYCVCAPVCAVEVSVGAWLVASLGGVRAGRAAGTACVIVLGAWVLEVACLVVLFLAARKRQEREWRDDLGRSRAYCDGPRVPTPKYVRLTRSLGPGAYRGPADDSRSSLTIDATGAVEDLAEGAVEVWANGDDMDAGGPRGDPEAFAFSWRTLWAFTGPGFLMSLAYLDPGNLEADLQQGAYTNYALVWVLFWSTMLGLLLQEMAARLGVVTGQTLAEAARAAYPRSTSLVLYAMMEIAIVGSDVQEVLGSAIGLNILFGLDLWVGCLITGLDTFTFLAIHHLGVRKLEALVTTMIATMAGCFFVNWGEAQTDGGALAEGLVLPLMKSYMLTQAVGTVGAVVMPHNLYLHSGLVRSRNVDRSKRTQVRDAVRYNLIESAIALACSFVINLAVVSTFADFFYATDCAERSLACVPASAVTDDDFGTPCASHLFDNAYCAKIGLNEAAPALKRVLGPFGKVMWGVGLLAAGQASTMTATFAGQFVMSGFLKLDIPVWKRVALTRFAALGPAVAVAFLTSRNLGLQNEINEYLNVLQSLQLPFAMLPLLYLTNTKHLMGRFTNGGTMAYVAYAAAAAVLVINVVLVVQFVLQNFHNTAAYVAAALFGALYFYAVSLTLPDLFKTQTARQTAARAVAAESDDPPHRDLAAPLLPDQ